MSKKILRAGLVCLASISVPAASSALTPTPVQSRRAPAQELWQIDQLQLPRDTPLAKIKALEPDHSMEAVMKRLRAMGVPFKRVRLSVLPDRLSPATRELVLKMPPGEPFVNPEPGYISVNVLIGRRLPDNVVRLAPLPSSLPPAQKA